MADLKSIKAKLESLKAKPPKLVGVVARVDRRRKSPLAILLEALAEAETER